MRPLVRSAVKTAKQFSPFISYSPKFQTASFSISTKPEFLEALEKINQIDPAEFTREEFIKETVKLHGLAKESHPKLPKFVFGSDTGSSISPEVIAAQAYNNSIVSVFGPNPGVIENEINAIKSLFIEPTGIKSEYEKQLENIAVFPTASTTQANKVSVEAVGNINELMGEIALASEHSHVFHFEVGQPAMKVAPADQETGKLTVEDFQKACKRYSKMGKKVKMVHLDQPTKGDYFYTPDEIKKITAWAHENKLAVSMDVERLVNFLPKIPQESYFQMTADCGVDVATLGMQKNGGARSSSVVVLDRRYLSDPARLEQRVDSFLKCLGGVTNSNTFIVSGWEEMIKDSKYQENAVKANNNSTRIADVISEFIFDGTDFGDMEKGLLTKKLEIQNDPLNTNMIFAKFPREFVKIFNKVTKAVGSDVSLSPDRSGVTRIVASHDTPSEDVDDIIKCLVESYRLYSELRANDMRAIDQNFTVPNVDFYSREEKQDVSNFTIDEVKDLFKALIKKSEEAILLDGSYNGVNRKFTDKERPMHPKVMAEVFAENSEGYHPPYADDQVTEKSAEVLRNVFNIDEDSPVVFTSSKAQAVTCVMDFLKATQESKILVSEGSHDEHCRYGRSVKALELEGEFKKTDKLDPKGIDSLLSFHNSNKGKHVPFITAVMIEQPTSKGYVYTPDEIKEIVKIADKHRVPVVLQTLSFTYDLAKTNDTYEKYATDTGVAVCTIGLQGLGGALSSAIVVLDLDRLPQSLRVDDLPKVKASFISTVANRAVKENGGRNSGSSTFNTGWEQMFSKTENGEELWKENAKKVNVNLAKIKDELRSYKFEGKDLEFENIDSAHNAIAVKLPKDFLKFLNKKGYEIRADEDGYTRVQVPYNLRDAEVTKFFGHFREAHQEFTDKKPSVVPAPKEGGNLKEAVFKEVKEIIRDFFKPSGR